MKRSEINAIMRDAKQMFADYRITLPPFVLWTPEEWKTKGAEVSEIKENMLGWDITDFGQGDFSKCGLLLITLRNGNQKNPEKYNLKAKTCSMKTSFKLQLFISRDFYGIF